MSIGIDRCGKSTQSKLLTENLLSTGSQAELIRFPNRETSIGQWINTYLASTDVKANDHTVHLLFSANRWEVNTDMEAKLTSGTSLVSFLKIFL